MSRAWTLWWAAGSVVVVVVGAVAPWARALGLRIDGIDDELVIAAALIAGLGLAAVAATGNRKLTAIPILAGLVALGLIARDIRDPAGPFGGPGPNFFSDHDPAGPFGGPGPNVQLQWGAWLALAGAIGLVLASIALRLHAGGRLAFLGELALPRLDRNPAASAEGLRGFGDAELLGELGRRLDEAGTDGARLIATLADRVHVKAAARLVEGLTPTRELDYARHSIRLVVSSTAIAKRLGSAAKEPFTVAWIEENVKPGDVFYDIGANVGPYSLIAAKVTGGKARVFSFEPAPASFRDLARNVALNDCASCVTPLPLALWSETKLVAASWRSTDAGAARHRIGRETATPDAMVVGITLDDVIAHLGIPAPTHAKIDVDGYELEVLRGAARTLARAEWRSLIVELDPEETDRNLEIRSLLEQAGFGPGVRHARTPTRRYPDPDRRPDVYWTFTRPDS